MAARKPGRAPREAWQTEGDQQEWRAEEEHAAVESEHPEDEAREEEGEDPERERERRVLGEREGAPEGSHQDPVACHERGEGEAAGE